MSVRTLLFFVAVAVSAVVGCSKSDPAATSQAGTSSVADATPPSDPAAIAAHAFVSAVVKGDTDGATQLLTPQAIEQFAASGQRFAAPGLDSALFRIGQVRKVSESQALVQCMLADKTAPAGAPEQEMCCLMKLVEGQWRVSGIAVDADNGQPMILNFEQAEQPQTPPAQQQFAEQPAVVAPADVRTAQEPAATPQR